MVPFYDDENSTAGGFYTDFRHYVTSATSNLTATDANSTATPFMYDYIEEVDEAKKIKEEIQVQYRENRPFLTDGTLKMSRFFEVKLPKILVIKRVELKVRNSL